MFASILTSQLEMQHPPKLACSFSLFSSPYPSINLQECDGGLRTWLLTTVCVTALCSVLGLLFHGRGDGTRPSRFLDDDDDDVWGAEEDSVSSGVVGLGSTVNNISGGGGGNGVGNNGSEGNGGVGGGVTPPFKMEDGGAGGGGVAEAATKSDAGGVADGENPRRDSMGEDSIIS